MSDLSNSEHKNMDVLDCVDERNSLRAIFNSSPIGMLILDEVGRIITSNEAALAMMKIDLKNVLKQKFGDAFYCICAVENNCGCGNGVRCKDCPIRIACEEALRIGKMMRNLEVKVDYKRGIDINYIWLRLSISPMKIDGHNNVVITMYDITERKESEEKIEKAMIAAEEGNKAKSQFLANMSHEIRTPLNGVMGMIELTLLTDLTEEQRENLMLAKSCASSLLVIIDDILDFSKMEAGKLQLEKINFNLREIIESVIKTHAIKAEEKKIELLYTFSSTLPRYVVGDPTRLKQILHNLISNAIKFTNTGSIILVVKTEKNEQGKDELYFSVEDTGIGIDETGMKKLFKLFSQVDDSMTRKFGGTGLGLMITKQLIELLNGRIWAESKIGRGSKFRFVLPCQEVSGFDTTEPIYEYPLQEQKEWKILLVEDNYMNQLVVSKILIAIGCQVAVVDNGLEAVHEVAEQTYDCILMDIQMPMMDGLEATRKIRELEANKAKKTPIIALTAHAIKGDKEKFLAFGMDEYIAKPVTIEVLTKKLHRVISSNEISQTDDDIQDILAYCNNQTKKQRIETKELSLSDFDEVVEKIKQSIVQENFDEIEKYADHLKVEFASLNLPEFKNLVFKIQLAARRSNLTEIKKCMEILLHIQFK